jgi:hypothetical protein
MRFLTYFQPVIADIVSEFSRLNQAFMYALKERLRSSKHANPEQEMHNLLALLSPELIALLMNTTNR